ncbi:MAG: hypothetical protein GX639_11410, partial [Fibrobacter sp.]|nr:hypothetical protein [Fibrobacter sp.]
MWIRLLTIVCLFLSLMLIVCKLPSPPPGPENSFVALEFKSSSGNITKDTLTDSTGKQVKICMIHNLTQYIDSSILKITKGKDFNDAHQIRSFKGQVDTTYYSVVFPAPGSYAVIFTSYIQGKPMVLDGTITIVGNQQTSQNQKPVLNVIKEIKTGAGQELVLPVSATDPDVNQQVTITVIKKPESATFTENLFKWTPALADTGSVTVKFTATDNGSPVLSVTDSCVIIVSATPVNRAPQWSIKSMQRSALPEVQFTLDVSSYCIDPDNDNLTFSLLAQPPAKDTITGNVYQFTPMVTDTGVHSISIVVSDPAGLTDTLTLELTILVPGSTSKPDIVPPVIRFRSPSRDTVLNVDSCEIKVICVDDSGCSVSGYCDGIAFTMVKVPSVPNLWTGLVKGLKSGVNSSIKIIATDSSAAKNTDSAFVRVLWSKKTTFALTINAANGSVTKSPDALSYDSGTVVTLTPVPSNNYHFTTWSGDLTGSTNPSTVTMNSAKTVTASFEANPPSTFALTVVSSNGTVKKNPDIMMYDSGSAVGLKATAATGYHFVKWTGDATGTTDSIAVQMTSAKNISANFEINSYELTLSAGTGGSISIPASSPATVTHGVPTTITAVSKEGYNFSGWSVSGSAKVADSTLPNTTVVLSGNATLTANFTQKTYSLTVAAGTGGSITAPTGSFPKNVTSGVATTINASISENYKFNGWTISPGTAGTIADPESATTTVTLNSGDATVTANYSLNTYQLIVSAATGGSITAPTGSFPKTVNSGESITITASASNSYSFAGWTVTAGTASIAEPNQASTTVKLTSEGATVTANFTIKSYSLTVKAGNGGDVSEPASSTITVNHGTKTHVQAVAKSGYEFENWSVTSGTATIDAPGSFSTTVALTSGNATVTANFSCIPITVSISASKSVCDNTLTYLYVDEVSGGGTGRLFYTWKR